jgi:uncharacterized protein
MSDLLPLFPLGTVLYPGMRLPLHVFEERYRQLIGDLLARPEPRTFGVIAIRKGRETGIDGVSALHEVGCVATVREVTPADDGTFELLTVGTDRFRLLRLDRGLAYFRGEVELLGDPVGDPAAVAGAVASVQAGFRAYLDTLAERGGAIVRVGDLPGEPLLLSYIVAAAVIADVPDRQRLLAEPDAVRRLGAERNLLARETAMLAMTTSRPAPDLRYTPYSSN